MPAASPGAITGLSHVCIHVRDIAATIAFYHGALGLPVRYTFRRHGAPFGAYFQVAGAGFIEAFQLVEPTAPFPGPITAGIVHFCFETADIDALIEELRGKGIACTDKKLGSAKAWTTWLADPDGNRIEVNQFTTDSAHHRGGVVDVTW